MSTTLSITDTPAHQIDADALVVAVSTGPGGPQLAPGTKDADDALGGTLAATLAALGATGEAGEVTKIATGGRLAAPLIAAVGIGAADSSDAPIEPEVLRRAAGAAVRAVVSPGGNGQPGRPGQPAQRRIALALPARDQVEAEAVALGALLGAYTFRRYRSEPAGDVSLTLLADGSHAAEAARRAEVLSSAVSLVRDLVNTGPSDLVPATFAARAEQIAAEAGLDITVLDEQALTDGGYGGILGVGQGSVHPPRLVRLEYAPPQASKVLVLAGKGITFDSGGLSLKPAKAMETMKSDMGGAAAVLGAMRAIAALGLPVRVIGYLPLAENMPSGTAQRPSDVLTIYGGTTVEVLNTDAEGRLVLADALARSGSDSPDVIVDVATLTGAQVVSLGTRVAGVMANDDALRDAVVDAAGRAGEAMWPMPLPDELRKGLDSSVADLANVAPDRNGGMLVAALFLREFVPLGVRWAHLDIAGPSYNEGSPHGYTPKGGTGAATRALVQIAQDMADGRL
ncbi:MAG TPA: leucyl aminopeptidase [Streptosporangiaceae bacterium]|nr:leucyl aminopeptidase [Streptosporangiaceae bacterium]